MCDGICAVVSLCVFEPPVFPRALRSASEPSSPTGTLPFRFGTLNFVVV